MTQRFPRFADSKQRFTRPSERERRKFLGGHAVDPEVAQGYIQRLRDVEAPLDRLSPPGRVGR